MAIALSYSEIHFKTSRVDRGLLLGLEDVIWYMRSFLDPRPSLNGTAEYVYAGFGDEVDYCMDVSRFWFS